MRKILMASAVLAVAGAMPCWAVQLQCKCSSFPSYTIVDTISGEISDSAVASPSPYKAEIKTTEFEYIVIYRGLVVPAGGESTKWDPEPKHQVILKINRNTGEFVNSSSGVSAGGQCTTLIGKPKF